MESGDREIATLLDRLMLDIRGGKIELRDDSKKTKWLVEIKPFRMSKFPVTQDLYQRILQKDPSSFKGHARPVETVSWFDAVEFCNALSLKMGLQPCYAIDSEGAAVDESAHGFRLPTEAQWEYACRADSGKVQYADIDDIAWYEANSGGSTHDVG